MKLIIEVTEDYYKRLKDKKHNRTATISDATILAGTPYEDDVEKAIKVYQVGYEMAKAKFERSTGDWISDGFSVTTTQYKCNECGMHSLDRSKYCPNCGADMKGGRE